MLFGTSGIRGLYGKEVTAELAAKVGNAIGGQGKKVILCSDTRQTSPILANALAAGAMQSGAEVIDLGVGPTPLLAHVTFLEKCDGAMITASHNPPEYNGIKLFSKGSEYSKAQEKKVEEAVGADLKKAQWDKAGQKGKKDCSEDYIKSLLSNVDSQAIRKRKIKVLIDAGNAAAYSIGPRLFEAAGCSVIRVNCDKPGQFARNLEPKPSTLTETAALVVKEKCDFGIAFDGDGDRAIAIDEKGVVLPLDTQLAVFIIHMLSKDHNKKFVTTVEASLSVRDTVESHGGKLFITPVGSLHVADEVKRQSAAFGGEPCGEYVFPFATPCAEGLLSAIMVAEIFAQKGSLSGASKGIKQSHMARTKYKCNPAKKDEIMRKISEKPQLEGRLSTVDGLRYDFEDGWLLIRPSGTEPAIRMTAEAKTEKKLAEIVQRAEHLIMNEIESVH